MLHSDRTRLNRCPDAQALLPEYVEGELGGRDRERVEGHLAICRACREEEARFRSSLSALRAPARPAMPRDLYAGFAHKLAVADSRAVVFGRRLRFAGATAVLLLIVGVVGAQLASRSKQQSVVNVAPMPSPASIAFGPNVKSRKGTNSHVAIGAAGPDSKGIFQSVPQTHNRAQSQTRRVSGISPGFLDVVPGTGPSARDQIRRTPLQAANTAAVSEGPGELPKTFHPSGILADRVSPLVPEQDAIVKVGGSEMTVKTAYREDSEGNRTEVHVTIASPEPSPAPDSNSPLKRGGD